MDDDRGARRRAIVRAAVGRPGSLNRWIIALAIAIFAWFLAALYVDWLTSLALAALVSLLAIGAFNARALLIGDEDEFRAAYRLHRRSRNSEADSIVPDVEPLDRWRLAEEIPPPPICDEADVRP